MCSDNQAKSAVLSLWGCKENESPKSVHECNSHQVETTNSRFDVSQVTSSWVRLVTKPGKIHNCFKVSSLHMDCWLVESSPLCLLLSKNSLFGICFKFDVFGSNEKHWETHLTQAASLDWHWVASRSCHVCQRMQIMFPCTKPAVKTSVGVRRLWWKDLRWKKLRAATSWARSRCRLWMAFISQMSTPEDIGREDAQQTKEMKQVERFGVCGSAKVNKNLHRDSCRVLCNALHLRPSCFWALLWSSMWSPYKTYVFWRNPTLCHCFQLLSTIYHCSRNRGTCNCGNFKVNCSVLGRSRRRCLPIDVAAIRLPRYQKFGRNAKCKRVKQICLLDFTGFRLEGTLERKDRLWKANADCPHTRHMFPKRLQKVASGICSRKS